jgi:predicted amidohydrolase
MLDEINIALAQISCRVGDKKFNIKTIEKNIQRAKKENVDLVVFPELALTGYVCRDLVYELAEIVPNGQSVRQIESIAKKEKVHVIFGMIEKSSRASAILHNTAILISPEGFVGKYQKIYLPTHSVFEEKRYFRAGYQTPVFETKIGKIGLTICYDIYFPEIFRLLRLKGAQLIVCISASPSTRREFFEIITAARAIENTVFVTFVNRTGIEDGLQFWGGSRIIAPSGSIISEAKYDEDDLIIVKINYSDMKRFEAFIPTLRDLRPEFFNMLKKEAENL